MLIWGVLEGPFYGSEVPNTNFEDDNVMMVLQVSSEDRVFPAEFWFNNMEEAREISDHFRKSITPLPMNMKEYELE